MEKVVIITPVKNLIKNGRTAYFEKLSQSIENQTYSNIEHLVLAGISDDDTDDYLQKYAPQHPKMVVHQADTKNKWTAMNVALELASGDYVLFLEDDTFLTNADSVEIMVRTLQENDADFTYGTVWAQPDVGNRYAEKVNLINFFCAVFIPLSSILCKTNVAKKLTYFNGDFLLTGDYTYMVQLFLSGKKGVSLPEYLTTACVHGTNLEQSERRRLSQKEMVVQSPKFFTGIDGITESQLEKAVLEFKISKSFINAVTNTIHSVLKEEIDKILNKQAHRFDEFIEFDKQGFNEIYVPLYGMGDALIFSAVAHKLYEKTGKKVLVGHKNKELFENNPYVVATNAIYDNPDALRLDDIARFERNNFKINFVTYWISYPIDEKRFFFTYPKQSYIAQMASRCAIDDVIDLKPEIYLTQEEKSFGRFFPKDRKQIAIMSSAISPRKQYPYFQKIVDELKDTYDFVQIGSSEDQILSGVKENMTGKLTLRQTAGVLYNSDLFVGELGGLMHMARAVDCPAVIAFSSSEPEKVTRYICNTNIGPKKVCKLSQKGLADKNCAPCINKNLYCCIRTVPVEKMIKAIHKQLKKGKQDLPVEVVRVKPNPLKNSINEYLRRYNKIFDLDNL